MTKYIYIIAIVLLIACENKYTEEKKHSKVKITAKDWDLDKSIDKAIIKEINFIPLETTDKCLIGKINKLVFTENNIFALDKSAKCVFIFNKNGKYIKQIGTYGHGPGEITQINDIIIDSYGRLSILDSNIKKVVRYDIKSSAFIDEKKFKIRPYNYALIKDSTICCFLKNHSSYKIKGNAIVMMEGLKVGNSFLPYTPYDAVVSNFSSIFKSRNVYYAPYLNNIIYKINKEGVIPFMEFDFGKFRIPEEELLNARTGAKIFKLVNKNKYSYNITNMYEGDNIFVSNLKVQDQRQLFLYSKKSESYIYGCCFEGILRPFKAINNLSTYNNSFYTIIDAYVFKKWGQYVRKHGTKSEVRKYNLISNKVSDDSNPILIEIIYNEELI